MEQETKVSNGSKTKKCIALSGLPMVLGWLAMLIFACHASTHMVAAGDTWVAMACGRHFTNHGVDTVEPFSANSHKPGPTWEEIETWPDWAQKIAGSVGLKTVKYWHPTGWVNQNWLTHVIFYWLTHLSPFADAETFSFNSLVYWKFAIYILTVISLYYTGRLLGVNPALSAFFSCAAMFIGRSFLDVRPAGFSNILVALFLLILVLTTYRSILYIWLIVPVAVFWCNVHGGYIYLFIMLMPFVGLNVLALASPKRFVSIGLKGIVHSIIAGFVAFLAVVIFNPFHLTNLTHTFIISVSKHAEQWRTVNEWHPAFEWTNPVGTGFPFLVLFVLSIGLFIFWLFSRLLKPSLLKAPKNELEAQRKLFIRLSVIFGCSVTVFMLWVVFIGFSFLNLSAVDFFICAVFAGILLLSIYKNIHFVYLAAPLTLLVLLATDTKGYAGRYIYPFVLLPVYVILHIIISMLSKEVRVKPKNIIFVALGAVGSLLLMMVFANPFKLESVLDIGQFLHLRRIWRPTYGISYTNLFEILYIINVASVVIWLTIPYFRRTFHRIPNRIDEQTDSDAYQLPKIDLALITIAALTIYMALRSRRFIPIAAFAACPVVAMLVDQMIRTISAARNFHKQNRLVVSPMPYGLQMFFVLAGVVAVLFFGTWWGGKFKFVYLDPWPTDTKLNSVFMRMTASYVKPFSACEFIRLNKLGGKVFNYWTEGGFIAYGQMPDPNTGRTPLQLFMDGRAQAAYEPQSYTLWSNIMFGGYVAAQLQKNAKVRKRNLTSKEYAQIGEWIDKELKKHNVWVVLMPSAQFRSNFVMGIEYHPDWQLAFFNNKQKLFVDRTNPQGDKLLRGTFDGKTIYPDDFSRNLIMAHKLLMPGRPKPVRKQGLHFALEAFEANPTQASMVMILLAGRYPELKADVTDFCKRYFDEFTKNKHLYAKQDGYHHRIWSAMNAGEHLQRVAEEQKNPKLAKFYAAKVQAYEEEQKPLQREKRW